MISKGYVALFSRPINREIMEECVISWLDRFELLEQVTSMGGPIGGLKVEKLEDLIWEENLQFRITNGAEFSWIYVTLNRHGMETSGLPHDDISLCLDVLMELPYVTEIIDEHNDKRLDELENEGLI